MLVGRVARALDRFALFRESRGPVQGIANAGFIQGVAMQMAHTTCHQRTLDVVPGAHADAVARVDGRLAIRRLRAQVGPPVLIYHVHAGSELLAMGIGTGQATQVSALARAHTAYKKAEGSFFQGGSGGSRRRLGVCQARQRQQAEHQG